MEAVDSASELSDESYPDEASSTNINVVIKKIWIFTMVQGPVFRN